MKSRAWPLACRALAKAQIKADKACVSAAGALEAQVIAGDEPHPTTEVVMAQASKHREVGPWAVASANANAWPGLHDVLQVTAADMVPVQEAKVRVVVRLLSAETALRTIM